MVSCVDGYALCNSRQIGGVQRTANGEQATRAIAMLTCLTGNVGIEGGGAAGAGWVREEDKPVYPTEKSGGGEYSKNE